MVKSKYYTLESDLARDIARWLQRDDWNVYMEVPVGTGRADLVGERAGIHHIVETKLSMSLTLLEQARDRLYSGAAHFVTVAVPEPAQPARSQFALKLCREWGVGVVWASKNTVVSKSKPKMQRPRYSMSESLRPERLFADDGTAGGKGFYWTPYKATCLAVRAYVRKNPGSTIREVIAATKHHYSSDASARATLPKRIKQNAVEGVRLDRDKTPFRLFPT